MIFYTQGRTVPSSRFRVGQFIPFFEQAGIGCTVKAPYPSVHGDVTWSRVHGHWRELFRPFSVPSRLLQLPQARAHDVVFIQRPLVRYYTTVFEEGITRLRPSIFDIDDAIFHNFLGWERFKIRRIVHLVRHVTAGNAYLADFLGAPEKTTIIPTVVDTDRYAFRPDPDGPLTFVWTGLSSNLKEFRSILPALRVVMQETGARLRIVSDRLDGDWLNGMNVDFVPWTPQSEVDALTQGHVGLMPLLDTPYNRGKCGFKLIQYMARGIPVVAADVGVNATIVADGTHGFVPRTHDHWVQALVTLARDPDLRARMGQAGRQRIETAFSVRAVLPTYLDLFRRLAA